MDGAIPVIGADTGAVATGVAATGAAVDIMEATITIPTVTSILEITITAEEPLEQIIIEARMIQEEVTQVLQKMVAQEAKVLVQADQMIHL
jgi:hypothetical protein